MIAPRGGIIAPAESFSGSLKAPADLPVSDLGIPGATPLPKEWDWDPWAVSGDGPDWAEQNRKINDLLARKDGNMSSDNGHAQDATPTPARPRWQIVITMNEAGCAIVAHNCPGGDIAEMLLYRALKYVERELTAGRLVKVEEPKVTIAISFPKGTLS